MTVMFKDILNSVAYLEITLKWHVNTDELVSLIK